MLTHDADPLSSLEAFLAPAPLRVAVVDDQPDAVLMLVTLLRDEGYEARGFSNARAALKELKTLGPDVIISDVSMPSMNGWELARKIRQSMGEQPTLIGISGHYTRGPDRALAELAGFNFYLTKPYDPHALMKLLAPLGSKKQGSEVLEESLSTESSGPRPRILVIDDDAIIRELLSIHLQNSGYEVLVAEDAAVGGRMIMKTRPDLIICDVNMPYLSGLDLVAAMKGDPATRDIPVVMLSADEDPSGRASRLGVAAYLKKPVQADRLLEVVALFADRHQELTHSSLAAGEIK